MIFKASVINNFTYKSICYILSPFEKFSKLGARLFGPFHRPGLAPIGRFHFIDAGRHDGFLPVGIELVAKSRGERWIADDHQTRGRLPKQKRRAFAVNKMDHAAEK